MRLSDRPSNVVAAVFTLVIAAVIGLAMPLAWGTLVGGTGAPWRAPGLVRSGVTDLATATAEAQRPAATSTVTRPSAQTRIQSERTANSGVEAIRLVSPTTPPRQPSASRTSTATTMPTEAITSATSKAVPTSTTPTPAESRAGGGVASPTTAAASQMPQAEVAVERLNLRGGPGQNYGVVAVAKAGSAFTVTARSADDAWLQVCCVNKAPAWLATEFVTVTGTIKFVPVAP